MLHCGENLPKWSSVRGDALSSINLFATVSTQCRHGGALEVKDDRIFPAKPRLASPPMETSSQAGSPSEPPKKRRKGTPVRVVDKEAVPSPASVPKAAGTQPLREETPSQGATELGSHWNCFQHEKCPGGRQILKERRVLGRRCILCAPLPHPRSSRCQRHAPRRGARGRSIEMARLCPAARREGGPLHPGREGYHSPSPCQVGRYDVGLETFAVSADAIGLPI